ncbi:MAG: chemotaxis protein CheA [bacterium]
MNPSPRKSATDSQGEFLVEAGDLLERINAKLLTLGALPPGQAAPPDVLNDIFRAAHSLKGLAGMFGFPAVAGVSHKLESLLDSLRFGRLPIDRDLLDVLFDGVELLASLLEKRERDPHAGAAADELERRIARLREGERDIDRAAIFARFAVDPALTGVLSEYEQHRLAENLTASERGVWLVAVGFDLMTFDTGLLATLESLRGVGEVIASVPDTELMGGDRIGFKILVGARLRDDEAMASLGAEGRSVTRVRAPATAPAAEPPAVAAPVAPRAPEGDPPASETKADEPRGGGEREAIRVDLPRLDTMLNLAGELLLSRAEIGRLAEDARTGQISARLGEELWRASQLLERRLRTLEELILDIRMVALDRLFERLARSVRRIARDLGKDVELATSGADTRLDKRVVEGLADPLMHLIRNAIDHGLETGEQRVAAGKGGTGRIRLDARQQGGHVLVSVEDDGRGVDWDAVRATAVRRGWLAADAQPGADELVELLCRPGFSTRAVADEVSGRGVGLDVVRNQIDALHGTIRFDTERNVGTRVTLTVPLTMARVRALIVTVADQSYALPLDAVERSVELTPEGEPPRSEREHPAERVTSRVDLARLLGVGGGARVTEARWLVILALGSERVGVVVDAVEGQQDVLVRDAGPLVSRMRGIAGAADVGQGRTLLLLEPTVLLEEGSRSPRPGS